MSNATAQLMQAMLSVLRQQGQPLRSTQLQTPTGQPATASRALAALVQNGAVASSAKGAISTMDCHARWQVWGRKSPSRA